MKSNALLFCKTPFSLSFLLLVAGMAVLSAGVTQAATISWGGAQAITGEPDVSLNGTSVYAYSIGTGEDGTTFSVNGVDFIGEATAEGNADITTGMDREYNAFGGVAPFSSLSTGYQAFLERGAYVSSGTGVITLNNLDFATGQLYEVQFWINDSRNRTDLAGRISTIVGTTRTVDHNTTDLSGGTGQYIIGTFTADAATQSFELSSSSIQLNGIQLRAISEPSKLKYALTLQAPNGYRIPKILGASGNLIRLTGYDYLDWFGTTEHRYWFKPSFSTMTNSHSAITSASAFASASEAIRLDPTRQSTASDYFIDWDHFYSEVVNDGVSEDMDYMLGMDIMPLIINTSHISYYTPITDDWVNIFGFWKYWYSMVYYFASEYDITLYSYKNEPHHNEADYDTWESQWLVCADAMQKAMDDVNRDFGKTLTLNIAGPTCAGAYWDYNYPDPYVDPHGWGSVSWAKVKYDIYGDYNVNNPWNYGMYDYHRYGQDAADTESILLNLRTDIANANNDPSADIPLVITEYNTSTGGNFKSREIDTEDLFFGVSMAQILEASAVYGPDGLGDEGGIFIFKTGAAESESPLVGVGNRLTYASPTSPGNFGGVTRGGACFQMYARHFSGGKPLVPVVATSGASDERRTLAVIDEEKGMYYIYGSNVEGTDVSVSIDMSALDVESGTVASLQRVDEMNTGQVTELLTLDGSTTLSFDCPDMTAFLIKVPMTGTVPYQWEITPSEDTTQQVSDTGNLGASSTMNISMHHSDAAQRNVGLLRFSVEGAGNLGQALLKLSGRNTGTDQSEREILHVYAVTGDDWSEESTLDWSDAPGLGQYHVDESTMGTTDGTGNMVDIEDNYGGYTSGTGTGLGLNGEFLGAVSFYSSDYVDNYLDVTDYLNSVDHDGLDPLDVTFVVARIVRYDVNVYSNAYYNIGEYHYDGRVVEIATKENAAEELQPRLICTTGLPPVIEAEDFANSSGVSVEPCSDVDGGEMVEFSAAGDSVSYEVRVEAAGAYLVAFRVASTSGVLGLELAQDGVQVTTLNRVIDAGEVWTTVYKMVTLQAGFTTLTVSATGNDVQFLNWLKLSTSNNYFEDSVTDPVNIALNQSASASSVYMTRPGYTADKAVDGNVTTRWASTEATPWLEVDFGVNILVNGVSMVDYKDRIRSYEIQAYNGSWETVFVGGNPVDYQKEWFSAVTGSKFRLQVLTSTSGPSVWEFELYGMSIEMPASMEMNADSMSLEWPNVPGWTYAVQRSTNLVTDAFAETVESGIPALTTTNNITVEMQEDGAAFYRIISE